MTRNNPDLRHPGTIALTSGEWTGCHRQLPALARFDSPGGFRHMRMPAPLKRIDSAVNCDGKSTVVGKLNSVLRLTLLASALLPIKFVLKVYCQSILL